MQVSLSLGSSDQLLEDIRRGGSVFMANHSLTQNEFSLSEEAKGDLRAIGYSDINGCLYFFHGPQLELMPSLFRLESNTLEAARAAAEKIFSDLSVPFNKVHLCGDKMKFLMTPSKLEVSEAEFCRMERVLQAKL